MDIINITYNEVTIQIIVSENGINIHKDILSLFKDNRGKMSADSFIKQPLIKFIYKWLMIVDEIKEKSDDKNDTITINIDRLTFDIDVYGENMLIDPNVRKLLLNKKGEPLTNNQFNKQPLIDFIARLSMINKIKNNNE